MDWSDNRPLAELTFGIEAPEPERATVAAKVRQTLADCGIKVADDIALLGCTGLVKHNVSVKDAQALRMGLAGSGCGLPCFVPLTRWCFVHETPGGLQEGQTPLHTEVMQDISRDLTPAERVTVDLVERARRLPGKNGERIAQAAEMLSGRALPGDLGEAEAEAEETPPVDADKPAPAWKCPDHDTTFWACRYCIAQAVVEGPLAPEYVIDSSHSVEAEDAVEAVEPGDIGLVVAKLSADETVTQTTLFVRVARWSRKLSRE